MYDNKLFNKRNIDTVIYHKGCADGMGSALAVHAFMISQDLTHNISYIPVYPGTEPPNLTEQNILICDVSFSFESMSRLINNNTSLLVIDHHLTNKNDLEYLDEKYKIFDMNHSAAYLTWKYLFGEDNDVPLLIEYIQDRDIWTNQLPYINEFVAWFYSPVVSIDIETYSLYIDNDVFMNQLKTIGKSFYDLQKSQIKQLVSKPTLQYLLIESRIYLVASINSPIHISDLGNKLMKEYPMIDFSMIYRYNGIENTSAFSLRSTDDHTDVSRIAKIFKGGGHRNASGVVVNGCTNTIGHQVHMDFYSKYNSLYWSHIQIIDEGCVFDISIVYFNTSNNARSFGRYLTQVKLEKDNRSIQNSRHILQYLDKRTDHNIIYGDWDHIAALWYYDGNTDRTYWHIVINSSPKYTNIIKKHLCGNGKTQFYYEGMHSKLDNTVVSYPTEFM